MNTKEIGTIRRFMGVIDCLAVSQPNEIQSLLHDCLEAVGRILDKEEENALGNDKLNEKFSAMLEMVHRIEQKAKGVERVFSITLPQEKYHSIQKEGEPNG